MNCLLCNKITNKQFCCSDHRKIHDHSYSGETFLEYCERRARLFLKRRDKTLQKKLKGVKCKEKKLKTKVFIINNK